MNDRKISIHYDPYGIEEIQAVPATIIHDTTEYVKGYKLLVDCLKSKNTVRLVVKNPTVFAWFRKLGEKYSEATLEIKEIRPCTLLSEKWGFTIPSDVTDEEIIDLNLLNLRVERTKNLTFADFILSKFVSLMMCSEIMPVENLSKLTASICKEEVQVHLQRRLVQKEFERRIESWLKGAKGEHEKEVIDLFWQKPKELQKVLSQYAILANYPKEVGERAAGKIFHSIKKLRLDSGSIILDNAETNTAVNNIEIFLNSEFKNGITQSDASKIVEWASGLAPAEFKILARMFEKSPKALTDTVLTSLRKKFSNVSNAIQPQLEKLELLLKPNFPSSPDLAWDANKMLDWVTKEYLVYHFWLEETDNEDVEASQQSELFGDWLYDNFINIRSNFPHIAFKILPSMINICASDKCVLVLVIDNFNYKFADVLASLLQIQGFRLVRDTPYFSMIPSDTEVSKRCLLSGQPEASEVPSDYDSLVSNEWPPYFPNRHFIYLRSSLELETLTASSKDIVFVNCTQIDYVLHRDERRLGKRHSVAIEDELRNLVNLVTGFFNRNMLTGNAQIVVCSDHGSTKIPRSVHNEINQSFFNEKSLETHHRFISISQEEYEKLPANIKFQCYFLEARSFGLSENVLVAKGYYRFKRTDEHFFVHGGLSPEETVVPLLVFEGGRVKFKEPDFRLLHNEFRYLTKASVEIEIVNHNSAPIEDMRITVISKGVETVGSIPTIREIAPAALHKTKINCRFYKTFEVTKGLEMTFEYKFLGNNYSKKKAFDVQLRSMMETSFKLDELI